MLSGNLNAQETCNTPSNNPGDLGCITFTYDGVSKTLATVRGADGKVWLQQNLGSSAVAVSATDAEAYGDLFQWGRWDDGHQSRNSTTSSTAPSPNNPIGLNGGNPNFLTGSAAWWKTGIITDKWETETPPQADAVNGCDPCKALGSGWSLPTLEDWTAIVASEQITDIATAFSSNLKLTVGGSRNASGGFNFTGARGYYWSKSTTTTTGYGKHLYYSNAIINASSGSYRELGMSVRCINATAVAPQTPTYCAVTVEYGVEPISSVNFANISNQSSSVVDASPAYEDFTSIVANVNKGNTYNLTVKGNTVGEFSHDIRAFFDWNNDGIFDMNTEFYAGVLNPSTGYDNVESIISVTIPATASIGNTRMRIIKDMWNVYEEGEFDACLDAYYGQIEDYTVNIQTALSTENFTKNTFKLYPNPTSGIVTVQSETAIKNITIYNQIGQLISNQNDTQIDLSNAPSGIYILHIDFENGQKSVQKIIKK